MSSATSSVTPSGRRSWQGSRPLPETGICIVNILCRPWRHHESALSFDAEKEGAGCGASVTGWRIGLILRAPCSAAARTLPRKTTCGGFWYFWPQKYKKKKAWENCGFPKTALYLQSRVKRRKLLYYYSEITPEPTSSSPSYHAANCPGVMPRWGSSKSR